jgi:hypothetical protein
MSVRAPQSLRRQFLCPIEIVAVCHRPDTSSDAADGMRTDLALSESQAEGKPNRIVDGI